MENSVCLYIKFNSNTSTSSIATHRQELQFLRISDEDIITKEIASWKGFCGQITG